MPDPQNPNNQVPKWLNESTSPYGLSDEDATLRQADSIKWRTLFGNRKTKRFIPIPQSPSAPMSLPNRRTELEAPRSVYSTGQERPRHENDRAFSSLVIIQAFLAGALVFAAVYVSHSHKQSMIFVQNFLHTVYSEDYSQSVVPTIQNLIHQFHWTASSDATTYPFPGERDSSTYHLV